MITWRDAVAWFFLFAICLSRFLRDPAPETVSEFSGENDKPVIGMVAQVARMRIRHGETFVPVPYVRYLQHAGARVVVVRVGEPYEYYTDMFSKLNGAFFPGGRSPVFTSVYARVARIFYNLTVEAFDKSGEVFPLWGTCLGFQIFPCITTGEDMRNRTDANNILLPLDLSKDFRNSRMLGQAPPEVITYLQTEPVTQHGHKFGILSEVFNRNRKLKEFYRVVSTNVDKNGVEFLSMYEGVRYPIYATQWHPEKNAFNADPRYVVNSGEHAVRAAQHFADFFVSEARKSSHRFPPEELAGGEVPEEVLDEKYYFMNFTQSAKENIEGWGQVQIL